MIKWKDISLYSFQYMDEINNTDFFSDIDKVLLITCEVFKLSEQQLDNMPVKRANKKIGQLIELMKTKPEGSLRTRVGPYFINYDPAAMTLGQFVELRYFLKDVVHMGHQVMASLASEEKGIYVSDGHLLRADFFLRQPVTMIMAGLNYFAAKFDAFLKEYDALFGLDREMYTDGQETERFNKHYGWVYSSTQIAEHERITLDEAYGLPIRQAFNDLLYLKAKSRYEAEQHQQIMKGIKK